MIMPTEEMLPSVWPATRIVTLCLICVLTYLATYRGISLATTETALHSAAESRNELTKKTTREPHSAVFGFIRPNSA